MPIGENLAEARRQAGLTVTQVSERTRIRETIIRGIEADDYSSCGGDFYARGNIRSIAKVVGTDSEPLIREYDTVHRAPSALSAVSLDELLATSVQAPQRRRPDWSTVWEPAAASVRRRVNLPAVREWAVAAYASVWGLVVAAYASVRRRVDLPAVREWAITAYASVRRRVDLPAVREWAVTAYASVRRRVDLPAVREWAVTAYASVRRRVDLPAVREWAVTAYASVRRRVDLPAVREWAVTAYASVRRRVDLPAVREWAVTAYASVRRRVDLPAVREWAVTAYASVRRRLNWAVVLGLALGVVLGFGVDRFLAGSHHAAVAPPAAGNHAVTHRHAGRSRTNPAPKTSQKAVAPSPAPALPAQTLTPASAAAFGPGGGRGDNPQLAHLAIDGNRATGWHTDWYTSARFGNLYPGTGLLLNMGRTVTITSVRINLGGGSGAGFQLRAGAGPSLTDLPPVARAGNTGGVVRLRLTSPAHGRYLLVWFTRLPADPAGTFQAGVFNIRVEGHA